MMWSSLLDAGIAQRLQQERRRVGARLVAFVSATAPMGNRSSSPRSEAAVQDTIPPIIEFRRIVQTSLGSTLGPDSCLASNMSSHGSAVLKYLSIACKSCDLNASSTDHVVQEDKATLWLQPYSKLSVNANVPHIYGAT